VLGITRSNRSRPAGVDTMSVRRLDAGSELRTANPVLHEAVDAHADGPGCEAELLGEPVLGDAVLATDPHQGDQRGEVRCADTVRAEVRLDFGLDAAAQLRTAGLSPEGREVQVGAQRRAW